jgi:Kef-type K+ transport system membrane component KefB
MILSLLAFEPFRQITEWIVTSFEHLYENRLYGVAILIIFGLIGGKLISLVKFPKVTGYILIGILIGPSVFELLSFEIVESFTIIRQVAIGFIGYSIGLELKFDKLKKTGKQVTIITLAQAFTTAVLVCLAVVLFLSIIDVENAWTYGLILGAIATATAPAPILAVVKNYRTKGPLTDMLLPLVALDDVIGIILFAIMLSFGTSLLMVEESVTLIEILLEPALEIFLSISIGALIGYIITKTVKRFNREDDQFLMMVIVGFIFLGIAVGQAVEASAILLPMTIGIYLTNSIEEKYKDRLTKTTDLFSGPILLSFFTIAGAELQLNLLSQIGMIGVVYLVVRVVGKYAGSTISAHLVKAPKHVKKWIGLTLIPQAGVAIDMALTTQLRFESHPSLIPYLNIGLSITTIVLAATVIYEIVGLIIVKTALDKAGEIDKAVDVWQ